MNPSIYSIFAATAVLLCLALPAELQTISNVYEAFLWTYGSNTSISSSELSAFITQLKTNNSAYIHTSRLRLAAINESCPSCSLSCQSVEDILKSQKFPPNAKLSAADLKKLLPHLFARVQNPFCYKSKSEEKDGSRKVWSLAVWGYGFLMVTIINGCALLGFSFSPFIGRRYYKLIMTFMVALAVGSLCGSAVLFLLPDALRLSELQSLAPNHKSYIWKSTVVMGGIYLFFWLERVLKWMIEWKSKEEQVPCDSFQGQGQLQEANTGSMNIRRVPDIDPVLKELPQHLEELAGESEKGDDDPEAVVVPLGRRRRTSSRQSANAKALRNSTLDKVGPEGETTGPPETSSTALMNGDAEHLRGGSFTHIAPVAWMIIVGDGVHNFIDGLSIGAAFSQNTLTGFSLSVAVLCEELPHELGDFAILLNSGMSMKQAMIANFGSACMCYFGLIIGIIVGELTESAVWIFSLAAGMFLYISLVDMLPEVNHMMESDDAKRFGRKKVFFLQNLGFFVGYGMLLCLAVFGEHIGF